MAEGVEVEDATVEGLADGIAPVGLVEEDEALSLWL